MFFKACMKSPTPLAHINSIATATCQFINAWFIRGEERGRILRARKTPEGGDAYALDISISKCSTTEIDLITIFWAVECIRNCFVGSSHSLEHRAQKIDMFHVFILAYPPLLDDVWPFEKNVRGTWKKFRASP